MRTPEGSQPTAAPVAPTVVKGASRPSAGPKILRFAKSERMLHWCIAGPFLFSFATALVLVAIYNPDPSRPLRNVFSLLHRVSGVALIVLPMLAALKSRRDARLHFYNIRQAWLWMFDDFKWLALMLLAAMSDKIKLPEQGKFNAAEKLNFMVLMVTYPLYVLTGILMWVTHLAILSWILHFLMAVLALPLISGHLYMALINPGSRHGLQGMITGFVDRQWGKHHYRRWYREHHEAEEDQSPVETREESSSSAAPGYESQSFSERQPQPGTPLETADPRWPSMVSE
ncbi:MAG: cytochrome b/b6 domain-containing protein [Bryobacterales bacterium]|nr:cytochrome b/b6 domain-containing protein [Bryobacterales bacterium]